MVVIAYYKTRNAGTRNNKTWNTSGTAEHPGTVAEQWNTPEHQWNTLEYQQNNSITPAEHPRTTKQYKRKKSVVFFKENLNLTLIHLTISTQVEIYFIADINYLFVHLFIYLFIFI